MSPSSASQFRPGDRVVWLCSPGRSILSGWHVQQIPAFVVKICKHRVKIQVVGGHEKTVHVEPENLIFEEQSGPTG